MIWEVFYMVIHNEENIDYEVKGNSDYCRRSYNHHKPFCIEHIELPVTTQIMNEKLPHFIEIPDDIQIKQERK